MGTRGKGIGLATTLAGILLLIGLFWGFGWYSHLGSYFLTTGSEDAVKDLYVTSYHIAYDEEATQSHAMNYPYGEYHTFTGMQPLIAMPLQLLRKAGVDHPERAVLPLMNLMVLLSVVLCALLLYLVLTDLGLPWGYATLAALLITLLSPQMMRMGGHISLSYYCAIPAALFFCLRHTRSGHWGWALAMGAGAVVFGLSHPYYLVFFMVVALFELLWLCLRRDGKRWPWRKMAVAVLLEVLLPLAVFYLFSHIGYSDGNRTATPWGLWYYHARPAGLLLPYAIPGPIDFTRIVQTEWEAWSYLGALPIAVLFIVACRTVWGLVSRNRRLVRATGNPWLNVMLLASLLLTIYACGVPLAMMPRSTPCYIGPLAQIRAMGRLSWLLYYVVGIVAFYMLYRWYKQSPRGWRMALCAIAVGLTAWEASAYNANNRTQFTHQWAEWTDYDNLLPENQWVNRHEWQNYQAILTLPVFNVGNELTHVSAREKMFHKSAYISMKTGLPQICNASSRSDMDQSWQCIAIGRTAFAPLGIAHALPDGRPLLVATPEDTTALNTAEKRILRHATPLTAIDGARLYTLAPEALRDVVEETQAELRRTFDSTISVSQCYALNATPGECSLREGALVFDDDVEFHGDVEISLWIGNILTDMVGRTDVSVHSYNAAGEKTQILATGIGNQLDLVNFDSGEGLVRLKVTLPDDCCHVTVKLLNRYTRPQTVDYRNVLIRPQGQHVAFAADGDFLDNIPVLAARKSL